MRPGPSMWTKILAMPGSTVSRPTAAATWSGASTPFCVVTTAVSGPMRVGSAASTGGSCHVLTASSTTSTGPIEAMSSVACAGCTVKSPTTLVTTSPFARIASRWAPRARNVTS